MIDEPLGAGGFGVVWSGRRRADGAAVAIKVGRSDTAAQLERFTREAEALAAIGPPHAPRLHDAGRLPDGRPWLAMERIRGRTLASHLGALSEPPPSAWVETIADALLGALAAAHAHGVVHRDFKPENIVLAEPDGRVVLLDFGLAKRIEGVGSPPSPEASAPLTLAGTAVGSMEYMAPEQIRGDGAIDARADLYAFGVVLFEIVTLRLPFTGETAALEQGHLTLRPPRPSAFAPVPEALEALILLCLAKDPARRPQSAEEARRALREASQPRDEGPRSSEGPRSASGAPSRKLIAEGRHPVVLLVADVPGAATVALGAVRAHRGFLARQKGSRHVAVFSGLDTEDPAGAALATARELVTRAGGRAALHLAGVTVRRRAQGAPQVYGAEVERPETWLPAEPWSGIAMTDALRAALPSDRPAEGSEEAQEPLVGRDDVVEAIRTSAHAAFTRRVPRLVTLAGDPGLGRTRLAAEAAQLVRSAFPGALVVSLTATPARAGAGGAEGAILMGALSDVADDAPAEAPASMLAIAAALKSRARKGPVAVILDDAQRADDAVLDALEYATLDGYALPLWVLVTAAPPFEEVRRAWGSRTRHHDRLALGPLSEGAAMELAARLLLPAEYPPAAVLERLAGWAAGNPACLGEITRTLVRAGLVRQRTGGGHDVAAADLLALPPLPAWQWLAARQLEEMPPELSAAVRLCSVLGPSFSRAELEGVQDALDRAGEAGTPLDVGFALSALARRRILRREEGERYSFQNGALGDAIYATLDAGQRTRLHRSALEVCRAEAEGEASIPPELGARIARHAAAAGELALAAEQYLRLGDLAKAAHRDTEAEHHYSAAIRHVEGGAAEARARAFFGRGRSRYRVARVGEALADFAEARRIAEGLGDRAMVAEVLLEEATALDWSRQISASIEKVEEARPLVREIGSGALQLRLAVADGRSAWRKGQMAESIELLERAVAEAAEAHDHEPHVIGLLILSFQLASAGRLAEAAARFDEVIALSNAEDDLPHLGAAYGNRVALWMAKNEPAGAVDDLQRAIEIARQVGNPTLERVAAYNVAMLLLWADRPAEALPIARRARLLEERFGDRPVPSCSLLLARILLFTDEVEEARTLVAWVDERCPPSPTDPDVKPYIVAYHRMLKLVLDGAAGADGAGWDEALAFSDNLTVEEVLEISYWRTRGALAAGRRREAEEALALAAERRGNCPMWRDRFTELESGLSPTLIRTSAP
ncbi:serine/threonine-protein kinase [Polyangium aurulentum]|uniref:serine/threonine-protein kinase n=1 Tax=Polyangium aurulentum TaxID=2567896 RepID=UPI001F30DD1F|nr:serine/threonine-protein kinase [Polyangium aurulentum]